MRAAAGSMRRKSIARLWRATSEIAPAISTPVGPPPTIAKVRRRWRLAASVHLDSGRAAADDREGEEALALGRVGGKLRALEGDEDAPTPPRHAQSGAERPFTASPREHQPDVSVRRAVDGVRSRPSLSTACTGGYQGNRGGPPPGGRPSAA